MYLREKMKSANIFFLLVMIFCIISPYTFALTYSFISVFVNVNVVSILILSTLYSVGIPFFIYLGVARKKTLDIVRIKKISIKNVIFIVAICIFIQPFMSFLSAFSMMFSNNNINEVATVLTKQPYSLALLAIAVVPAIFEELLMRGAVLDAYDGLDLKRLAIVNGLFFGFLHGDFQQFFYASLLGFIFVYFVKLTGSILASILGHFVINGSQITLAFLVTYEGSGAITIYDVIQSFIFSIPFLVITILLMKVFIKNNQEAKDAYELECQIYDTENQEKGQKVKVFDKYFALIIVSYITILLINYLIY